MLNKKELINIFGQCENCGKDYQFAVNKEDVEDDYFCPLCGKATSNNANWSDLGEPDSMSITPDGIIHDLENEQNHVLKNGFGRI